MGWSLSQPFFHSSTPSPRPRSPWAIRNRYLLPPGIVLLVLLFWLKSQAVNLSQHNVYVDALRHLQELDALVNQELLQVRQGLLDYYDPVVQKQAEIEALQQRLAAPPRFVGPARRDLQTQVQDNLQLWEDKGALIQRFTSKHAVLRNSLAYFPIAVAELAEAPEVPPEVTAELNALLQNVLLFNLSTSEDLLVQLEADIEQLRRRIDSPAVSEALATPLDHADIILENRLEADTLLESLLALPTRQQAIALAQTYDAAYQGAIRSANLYRLGLYIVSTVLVLAIATSTISKLQAIATALRQSEATKQALFMAIPDFMLRMYRDSPAFDVISAGKNNVLPDPSVTHADLRDVLPLDLVERRLDAVQQALDTGKIQVYEQYLERSGCFVWEEVRVVPCSPDEALVMIRGICDRKRAEANLQRAIEDAQVASQAKSQFLSNMSHELRTPLNVILGFTQLMARDRSLAPQQEEYLTSINQSGEHLLNLINDVLEMSKIEAGKVSLNPSDVDLYDLLAGIHLMFQLKTSSKGLDLRLERSPDLPHYIRTDESKLRQILVNLVGNAVKFTDTGHICLRAGLAPDACNRFEADAFPTPQRLQFEVEDTGSGIASDALDSLFEPFVQADPGQANHRPTQTGTGLGLPISKKFVELMGGELVVTSEPGQGSCFCFSIQAATVLCRPAEPSSSDRAIVGLAPGQPAYRVLIAEDVAENRQLLMALLKPVGFDLKEAQDGQEAVQICRAWRPHFVWMDLRMPVMDGYEATQQIKALEDAPVVVAITGSVFQEEQNTAIAAGCDDFIRKPFRTAVIFEKLATFLGVRYRYEDALAGRDGATAPSQVALGAITAAHLQVMPPEWRSRLHQAATRVDGQGTMDLIADIPPEHAELAQGLRHLVNSFSFERLVALSSPLKM
ncbi:MAG: DAHL domain-containing protein [Elainellaceae cyanobacterium]